MNNQDKIQRTVLPIPDRPRTVLITYDAKDPDTKFPPIRPLWPPKGAPNVLIVLRSSLCCTIRRNAQFLSSPWWAII
jgi:hypothetical protein